MNINLPKDLDIAMGIIANGKEYLESIAEKIVDKSEGPVYNVGNLWIFDKEEYLEIQNLRSRISNYIESKEARRPLSIAIFGPPGSGKSHAVKTIQSELQKLITPRALPFFEINLTQVSTTSHLQSELRYIQRAMAAVSSSFSENVTTNAPIPFVFFDEFDAPRSGAPLGWLDWFLSPMNDGVIGHGEGQFEFRRAVYIFAGGTAPTQSDFSDLTSKEFIEAKGPDFISRINVFLDVRGPNHEVGRLARRAVVIRQSFNGQNQLGSGPLRRPISGEFANCLLYQGRFKHGSRSISAICELAKHASEKEGAVEVLKRHLPERMILEMHADQGELDPQRIHGIIGVSIARSYQSNPNLAPAVMFKAIVNMLWSHGATLGYGGRWDKDLTKELLDELKNREVPQAIEKHRVELFSRDDSNVPSDTPHVYIVPTFASWEQEDHSQPLSKSVGATRMRWLMSSRCVARVVVGGGFTTSAGRMSGILEELVFALALDQPVYILGALGGVGAIVGKLLGFGSLNCNPDRDEAKALFGATDKNLFDLLRENSDCFQPIPSLTLPLVASEVPTFLMRYAYGGRLWPNNGLSLYENRTLFTLSDPNDAADLILIGLRRRFGSYR